jgi:hypothetical protein
MGFLLEQQVVRPCHYAYPADFFFFREPIALRIALLIPVQRKSVPHFFPILLTSEKEVAVELSRSGRR